MGPPRTARATPGRRLASPELKATIALALDDKIQMRFAQFNLANMPARGINLFGYQRRPFEALSALVWRNVVRIDRCNGRRCGIEVGLELRAFETRLYKRFHAAARAEKFDLHSVRYESTPTIEIEAALVEFVVGLAGLRVRRRDEIRDRLPG